MQYKSIVIIHLSILSKLGYPGTLPILDVICASSLERSTTFILSSISSTSLSSESDFWGRTEEELEFGAT